MPRPHHDRSLYSGGFHARSSMLPQARPLLFAVYLAAVALILAIILGLSPQIVWQRVDPVGYGVWRIEHAEIFAAPYRNDAGRLEEAVPAWRVVMRSSAAGHLLTDLARRTNPITRLYALAGLTLRDSPAADSLKRALLRDTTLFPSSVLVRKAVTFDTSAKSRASSDPGNSHSRYSTMMVRVVDDREPR